MADLAPDERQAALQDLLGWLQRWHLAGAARLMFGTGRGAGVVSSQLLLALQPLAPAAAWRRTLGIYAQMFEDDATWAAMLELLDEAQKNQPTS